MEKNDWRCFSGWWDVQVEGKTIKVRHAVSDIVPEPTAKLLMALPKSTHYAEGRSQHLCETAGGLSFGEVGDTQFSRKASPWALMQFSSSKRERTEITCRSTSSIADVVVIRMRSSEESLSAMSRSHAKYPERVAREFNLRRA